MRCERAAPSRKQFDKFLALTSDLGLSDGFRLFLRELGIRVRISTEYPGLKREFIVRFDPVWRWIRRGERERGFLRFAEDCIRPGETVLDIGAHLGESSLLFSELVGPQGKVVAFEPDPVARGSLMANLELNGARNVTVEKDSVSDKAGAVTLLTERLGSGAATIVRSSHEVQGEGGLEVGSTTVDLYCESHGLRPDWVKIDAEGAEPLVIRGMRGMLRTCRPSVILEFHMQGLSEEEKANAWAEITDGASSAKVLDVIPAVRAYLEELPLGSPPECEFLIIYLEY